MFNRLTFKGQPEIFALTLGYSDDDSATTPLTSNTASRGALTQDTVTIKWTAQETENEILKRVEKGANDPDTRLEYVSLAFITADTPPVRWNIISAASYNNEIKIELRIESSQPPLRSVHLTKETTGSISTAVGVGIWSLLDVSQVTRLHCTEGVLSLWDAQILNRFSSLKVLNLSLANLNALPGVIGTLTSLEELRVVGNHLKILPPDLGKLAHLKILAADSNEISILPGELRKCTMLEELTLENNRLSSVLLNFGAMRHLKTLLLSGNPLEFLPEISPCQELRTLSVANLRVSASADYSHYDVELVAPTSQSSTINISLFDSKQTDKLKPIFSLMLRRSSGHHPLLAGAFRYLAEDSKNRDLMAKQENAFQQLILMALNDDSEVVDQTCKTLALLAGQSPSIAENIINADAGSLVGLLRSVDEKKQLASLGVLAAISLSSSQASDKMLSKDLLSVLLSLSQANAVSVEVRIAALRTLGNLAFTAKGKSIVSMETAIMDLLLDLSKGIVTMPSTSTTHQLNSSATSVSKNSNSDNNSRTSKTKNSNNALLRITSAAIRVLAILGDTAAVAKAIRRPLPRGRGLRVLTLDGGGMKGLATVQLLRRIEAAAGNKPIHQLFDLIVGTSTGGLLAVAIGLRKFSMDECENIYKVLGQQVFSKPASSKEKDESWMETFYRAFQSKTQHVRAVVVGYKHDAAVYEALLKEYCSFKDNPCCLSDTLIDTAALDVPKIALVSTLASFSPATPYVFRNYELPILSSNKRDKVPLHPGSSKHAVWQAVRASSAAIYYLDDFTCGSDKFQDGAVVANNPGVIAVQEARALWPDIPIDVFVSVGTGSTPTTRRDKGLSSFVDTGNILIESATNVERVHEALATMAPLMPNMKYYRFNPVDARCNMELDEIDPEKWATLEKATGDFIKEHEELFDAAGAALLGDSSDVFGTALSGDDTHRINSDGKGNKHALKVGSPLVLGLHRDVFMVASPSLTGDQTISDAVAASCARSLLSGCKFLDLHAAVARASPLDGDGFDAPLVSSTGLSSPPRDNGTLKSGGSNKAGSTVTTPVSIRREQKTVLASHAIQTQSTSSMSFTETHNSIKDSSLQGGNEQHVTSSVVDVDIGSALGSVLSWFSPSKTAGNGGGDATSGKQSTTVVVTPPSNSPWQQQHGSSAPNSPGSKALPMASPNTISSQSPPLPSHQQKYHHKEEYHHLESIPTALHAFDMFEHELVNAEYGIVHIALSSCATGLVLKWKDSFAAVHVPSDQANKLVAQAMGQDMDDHSSSASLMEYFERCGGQIMVGNTAIRLVSTQYRRSPLGGQLTAIALLQYTSADEVFDALSIKKLRSTLHGKLVVCTDVLIKECIDAFLSIGVLGVIVPVVPLEHVAGCTASIVASFLSQLYFDVQKGGDCVKALRRAESTFESLENVFKLYSY